MIHIAYCFDKNYRAYFGASVTSLLLNCLTDKKGIHIHALTDEVDEEFQNKLNILRCTFGVAIHVYLLTEEHRLRFSTVPLPVAVRHLSVSTYFRWLLPELLPTDIHKLLYIDADTIVLGDIAKLYHQNLGDNIVAGVLDRDNANICKRLGLKKYINSGVMLIDLSRWRLRDCTDQCINFAMQYPQKIIYADQCIINQVLHDEIAILESHWNKFITPRTSEAEVEGALILHFITADKPWQAWYGNPIAKYFWQYLLVSPWQITQEIMPRTYQEAWRYARKLRNDGKLLDCINAYEGLIQALAKAGKLP